MRSSYDTSPRPETCHSRLFPAEHQVRCRIAHHSEIPRQRVWDAAYQAHFSGNDIKQLREFIETPASEPATEASQSGIGWKLHFLLVRRPQRRVLLKQSRCAIIIVRNFQIRIRRPRCPHLSEPKNTGPRLSSLTQIDRRTKSGLSNSSPPVPTSKSTSRFAKSAGARTTGLLSSMSGCRSSR